MLVSSHNAAIPVYEGAIYQPLFKHTQEMRNVFYTLILPYMTKTVSVKCKKTETQLFFYPYTGNAKYTLFYN